MPAENAAMKNKVHPEGMDLRQHRRHARASSSPWACRIDWSREIATCDPAYYQHQQRMFLDFLESRARRPQDRQGELGSGRPDRARQRAGHRRPRLALRRPRRAARADPVVLQDHRFRAGPATTASTTLDRWPEKVRLMQRNWIGRSEGLLVRFALERDTTPDGESELEIYTTRPDTLFGAKFMAIAPDHPLAQGRGANEPGACRLHRGMPAHGHRPGGHREGREARLRHRHPRRCTRSTRPGSCRSTWRTSS